MRILVFGGSGLVGSRFIDLNKDSFEIFAPPAEEVDILSKDQLVKTFADYNPQIVINFAAFTDVQGAQSQINNRNGICFRLNTVGSKNIADDCRKFDKKLIHISTDYIFDGEKEEKPYTEDDKPSPKNWYGQTKFLGEEHVKQSGADFIIARISMPYVAHYEAKLDVARFFLEELKAAKVIHAINDQSITPTLADDIVSALTKIADAFLSATNKSNLYHISVTDDITPFDFATMIGEIFNLDTRLIKPISLDEYNKDMRAKLLRYSRLDPARFIEEFGEGILRTIREDVTIFRRLVDESSLNQL